MFWKYRHSNLRDDLSISERKVQFAIDNEVYSFLLTNDERALVKQGKLARLDVTSKSYKISKKSKDNHESEQSEKRIENSDHESIEENDNNNSMEDESISDDDFDENLAQAMGRIFDVNLKRKTDVTGINDHHMTVDLTPLRLLQKNVESTTSSSNVGKPLRTRNAFDQVVDFLNHAMNENTGFKEVCSGLERFRNLAGKQAKIDESRDAARSKLFSLADLQSDSATKI